MELPIEGGAVLLFLVRWPAPGRVKSRLAAAIGEAEACEVYRLIAARCFERAMAVAGVAVVVCHTGGSCDAFKSWLRGAEGYWEQPEGALGERLEQLFGRAFAQGARVVGAVGSDAPALGSNALSDAMASLAKSDVAVLPATDGGYVFIGVTRNLPELFRGIPWSTADTLSATLSVCETLGLSVTLGPTFGDVDTLDDWNAARRMIETAESPQGVDSQ